jgi:hypothetical protein
MRHDEIMAEWAVRLLARCRAAYRAYRRERSQRCIRCGERAAGSCQACGALVCNRCWLPSIETGELATLCLDCTAAPARAMGQRSDAVATLRSGTVTLGWTIAALGAWTYWGHGADGPRRLIAVLLEPTILLGLFPLAFLLGVLRNLLIRSLRGALKSPSKPSA